MRAAILFLLAAVVGRTTAFAPTPSEKSNAPIDIREEPSSLNKRKQKTGIAYRSSDDPMVSSPKNINPKYLANGQVAEQSQEHVASPSSPVSVTEDRQMTHDNTVLDRSASIHNYVKISIPLDDDTKAKEEWQVLPPSAKSIRTLNPIRAIVDPIVANIMTGEERGDGKNHISLGVSVCIAGMYCRMLIPSRRVIFSSAVHFCFVILSHLHGLFVILLAGRSHISR
jgi:hypothetical protein